MPLSQTRLWIITLGLVALTSLSAMISLCLAHKQMIVPTPNPIEPCQTCQMTSYKNSEAVTLADDLSLTLPKTVKQGEMMVINLPLNANSEAVEHIHFLNRDFKAFIQPNQTLHSLVPVPVAQKVGSFMLSLKNAQGKILTSKAVKVVSAGYSTQNIRVSKSIGGTRAEPGELAAIGNLKKHTNPKKQLWSPSFIAPTPDCMNSRFGNLRYHNGTFTGNYHKGIDLKSPLGRPVKAPTAGIVTMARTYRLHGGTVGLDHGQGLSSVYIHLSQILVKPGQHVAAGQIIGKVGSTGFATGPHLHWGVYANGQPVNPTQWTPSIKACH